MPDLGNKKVLLIQLVDKSNPLHHGIIQKVLGQKEAFENLGWQAEIFFWDHNVVTDDSGKKLFFLPAYLKRYFFFSGIRKQIANHESKTDLVYIRYPFASPAFIGFLKSLKKIHSNVKFVLEVPTYPYKQEFYRVSRWKYLVDQYFQKNLKRYIDLAVVIGNETPFGGINSLYLTNGITIKKGELVERITDHSIKMIAVGHWRSWHGLDRVINGLSEYYSTDWKKIVQLQIIGDGEELNNYIKLVTEKKLQKYITFSGKMTDVEVVKACNLADIGVGVLGSHRKGLLLHSPLKHRTYISCGLPVFFSTPDPDLSKELPFVLQVEENDKNIDIQKVINFVGNNKNTRIEIVDYAITTLSWEIRIQKIIDQLFSKV